MEYCYCRLCMSEEDLKPMNGDVKSFIQDEFQIRVDECEELSKEICSACDNFLSKIGTFKSKVRKRQALLKKIVKVKGRDDNKNNANEQKTPKESEKVSKSTSKQKKSDVTDGEKSRDNVVVEKPAAAGSSTNGTKSRKESNIENAKEAISSKSKSVTDTTVQSAEVGTSGHTITKTKVALNSNDTGERITKPDEVARNEEIISLADPALGEIVIKKEPGTTPNHLCPFCPKTFYYQESLASHHRRHHKDILKCPQCSYWSKVRSTFCNHLREHYGVKHPQRMCSLCFKVTKSSKELADHRRLAHEYINLICVLCSKKVTSLTELKRHQMTHGTQTKKHTCKRCNRKFLNALVVEKHQCTALKFICPKKCGKRFENSSSLDLHSKKCNGSTIYKCKFCKKNLKTLQTLQQHLIGPKCAKPSNANPPVHAEGKVPPLSEEANCSKSSDSIKKDSSPIEKPQPQCPSVKNTNAEKISFEPHPRSYPRCPYVFQPEPRKRSYAEEKSFSTPEFNERINKRSRWTDAPRQNSTPYAEFLNKLKIDNARQSLSRDRSVPTYEKPSTSSAVDQFPSSRPPFQRTNRFHNRHHVADSPHNDVYKPSRRSEPRYDGRFDSSFKGRDLRDDFQFSSRKSRSRELRDVCEICLSIECKYFCNPCQRCFKWNESQYLSHRRMKH